MFKTDGRVYVMVCKRDKAGGWTPPSTRSHGQYIWVSGSEGDYERGYTHRGFHVGGERLLEVRPGIVHVWICDRVAESLEEEDFS